MSIKQEPDTVKEDLANLDCDGDIKSDIKENSPRVKTEQFVQEENSALPNIINSQEQYVKDQVRTYDDFSGQGSSCEKADLLQEKEASAMAGYYHSINSNFTDTYCKSQFMSVQLKEEFTEHNTQVAIKYELNASTDSHSDIKIYKSGVKQDAHSCLPNSDDVLPNHQDQVKVYRCDTCPYSSNYLIDLYQHNISHGMDTVYFCDLCQSSYQYFLDLKCHLATHTATCENSSQPFHGKKGNFSECQTSEKDKQNSQNYYPQNNDHIIELFDDTRNYTYKLECEVKQQNESNTGNVNSVVEDTSKCQSEKLRDTSIRKNTYPYACDLCKYSCTHFCHLKQHKRSHTGEKSYSCDLCGYASTELCNLKKHIRRHSGEKPYSCDLCGYAGTELCNLKKHIRRHTGEKPYSCDLCSYTCARAFNLKMHKRHHTGEKPYSCDLCSYTYTSASELKIHKRCHTGEKPYSCDLCSYTCACAANLRTHKRRHTGEKPYSCDLCNHTCTTASELKIHKRCHTNEKPYSCDLCSYTSTQAANLRTHKRFHTGEKPYSCDLCSYTCATTCKLKLHKRRHHTGEKPYSCDLCSYASATAFHLKRHKRRHTGEKPYSCDLCSYTSSTAYNLKIHKRRHHTGEK